MNEAQKKKNITAILAFFEIWNFPLSQKEIENFLGKSISSEFLEKYFSVVRIGEATYYSTSTQQEVLRIRRIEGGIASDILCKKAQKYANTLKKFPFLKGVALVNTAAMGIASKESDIDFFIITKTGRIWTARFWSTLFFHLLRIRASKQSSKGKFCLSFFMEEEHLSCASFQKEKDVYFPLWMVTLTPLWGKKIFQKFLKENFEIRSSYPHNIPYFQLEEEEFSASVWQKIYEFLLPKWTERISRWILLRTSRKFRDPESSQYAPDMIFTDYIQKLHNPDLRDEIYQKWERNVEKAAGSKQ